MMHRSEITWKNRNYKREIAQLSLQRTRYGFCMLIGAMGAMLATVIAIAI